MRTYLLMAVLLLSLLTPAFGRRHRVRSYPNAKHTKNLFSTQGSLAAQDAEADRLGLKRVRNDAELREQIRGGLWATLPTEHCQTAAIKPQYRFLKPHAAAWLAELCQTFSSAFQVPLFVSSAVRPMKYQSRLRRLIGHTAAAPEKSVHPAGIAFDLTKRRLTKQQVWLRWRLWYWTQIGRAIVEEERACFHVVVIKSDTL